MLNQFLRSLVVSSTVLIMACSGSTEKATDNNDLVIDIDPNNTTKNNDDKKTDPDPNAPTPVASASEIGAWIVSPEAAKDYLDEKGGMILDTRSESEFDSDSILGSQNVSWQTFSMTEEAERGELLALDEIGTHLEGLTADTWVFVVGNPVDGWGEDGRIVWMLQALGHDKVALIDGGFDAAKEMGITASEPKTEPMSRPATQGDPKPKGYEPSVSAFKFSATAEDVKAAIDSEVQLIDVREKREFDGETPYGESRGGHVPTAIHLHYKSLIDEKGNLLSREQIREVLTEAGIDPEKPSIAYCTGGVRSAWLTAVLIAIDIDVTNYAGSMWQWSSYPAEDFPLE